MQRRQSLADTLREIWVTKVWLIQAIYYIPSGIWAVAHIRSFQWLTGPKTDLWLVKTVGLLVTAVGLAIGLAGRRKRITPEIALVGIGSAASLTAIDLTYTARRRISPIYLGDALMNLLIIAGWILRTSEVRRD